MTGPSGLPWSEQQRQWLHAMGHEVLMPVPASPDGDADPNQAQQPPATRSLAKNAPEATARPAVPADALLRALARAAGRPVNDQEFLDALPDLAGLRSDPRARRALWPRLRGLRRRKPG